MPPLPALEAPFRLIGSVLLLLMIARVVVVGCSSRNVMGVGKEGRKVVNNRNRKGLVVAVSSYNGVVVLPVPSLSILRVV